MNIVRPQFIAEISANHLGSLMRAKELVRAAAEAGATAVKFQTYTADTMTLDLDSLRISSDHELWGNRKLYDLYKEAHTPWEWHEELFGLCRKLDVIPFSSPFDISAVNFLESLNVEMYKIASLETSDHALIKKVAETGKPIIISTGATEWQEIEEFVEIVKKTGNRNLTLLLCTTVIEKHLTLNRSDGGLDSAFSLETNEFKALVEEGNKAFASIGNSEWQITESEKESRRLRRSLYIVKNVKKGDLISSDNLRAIRPGAGCSPKHLSNLLGKYFAEDYVLGTPMELAFALEVK